MRCDIADIDVFKSRLQQTGVVIKTLKTTHILIICFNSSLSIKQINTEYCLVGFDTMQSG